MKTNAIRLLEELGMSYELREYPIDEDDLGAIKVAGQIGLPARQVFKTLVAKGETTGVVLAVVPGDVELDLKALARLAGNRKMDLVAINELRQLTGYVRGGVTALACKKPYPVYLDDSAMAWPLISISAGLRGLQILLRPADYLRATSASLGRIARS
jgi:Cys-tRNA(Pro)/Cys-tRNA(Cys) deacylase